MSFCLALLFQVTHAAPLSPDKNPGNEKIQERFARLGVVSTVLSSVPYYDPLVQVLS